MKFERIALIIKIVSTLFLLCSCRSSAPIVEAEKIASLTVNPKTADIEFFWRDERGRAFKSIANLKNHLEQKNLRLRFAMNGGMYETENAPKGLFVQNQKTLKPLDAGGGDGNFYLNPNGVFYLTTENEAFVTATQNFADAGNIKFATQSGPMLLVDGEINPEFKADSTNFYVRNGVGILPDKSVVFAISRQKVNFYEFAAFFKKLNCRAALYLDGYVSRMYLPAEKIEQMDGDFAVIIAVVESN